MSGINQLGFNGLFHSFSLNCNCFTFCHVSCFSTALLFFFNDYLKKLQHSFENEVSKIFLKNA